MATRPDPPGAPAFSNLWIGSVTVSWTASPNNHGSPIDLYKLRRWYGSSPTGAFVDSDANNLTRNVDNLMPGMVYTFATYAHNGSGDNYGWSNISVTGTVTILAGVWVRKSGLWVTNRWQQAIPYVRSGGVWKPAVPYVRSGGVWHSTQ